MKQGDKPIFDGITFDSWGEVHLYWWLKELQEAGFIESIEFHPAPFKLSNEALLFYKKEMKRTEDKTLPHTILNSHEYTADIEIKWNTNALGIFIHDINTLLAENKAVLGLIRSSNFESYVEVKPSFDQNNMTRLAVINQKWVWDKYGVFVNIVVPEKLFEKTFTPQRYLFCDKSPKPRKIKYTVRMLNQFLEQQ